MVEHIYLAYTKLLLKKKTRRRKNPKGFQIYFLGMVVHPCNLSIWEVETGYQEFKVSLTTD